LSSQHAVDGAFLQKLQALAVPTNPVNTSSGTEATSATDQTVQPTSQQQQTPVQQPGQQPVQQPGQSASLSPALRQGLVDLQSSDQTTQERGLVEVMSDIAQTPADLSAATAILFPNGAPTESNVFQSAQSADAAMQAAAADMQSNVQVGVYELLQYSAKYPQNSTASILDQEFGISGQSANGPNGANTSATPGAAQNPNNAAPPPTTDKALTDLQTNPAVGASELLAIAAAQPNIVSDPTFTKQLTAAVGETTVPSDSTSFATDLKQLQNPGQDQIQLETTAIKQALTDLQSNESQGMHELMEVTAIDPQIASDSNVASALQAVFAPEQALLDVKNQPATGIQELMDLAVNSPGATKEPTFLKYLAQQVTGQASATVPAESKAFTDNLQSKKYDAAETQALTDLKSNELQGIIELMDLVSGDIQIVQDPNLVKQLESDFPGTTASAGPADSSGLPAAVVAALQKAASDQAGGLSDLVQQIATNPELLTGANGASLAAQLAKDFNQPSSVKLSDAFNADYTKKSYTSAEADAKNDFKTNPLLAAEEFLNLVAANPSMAGAIQKDIQSLYPSSSNAGTINLSASESAALSNVSSDPAALILAVANDTKNASAVQSQMFKSVPAPGDAFKKAEADFNSAKNNADKDKAAKQMESAAVADMDTDGARAATANQGSFQISSSNLDQGVSEMITLASEDPDYIKQDKNLSAEMKNAVTEYQMAGSVYADVQGLSQAQNLAGLSAGGVQVFNALYDAAVKKNSQQSYADVLKTVISQGPGAKMSDADLKLLKAIVDAEEKKYKLAS
ncbi:MAG TPA: hypothetical protein V6C72_02065, partial [Chroococcales cyanobacterium]